MHLWVCGVVVFCAIQSVVCVLTSDPLPNEKIVIDHVRDNANLTFRNASGYLTFPYLVPAGPYNQLWDWDSVFMGVGLLDFGSAPFLAGSMLNFLSHTNLTDGDVKGCLTPEGTTPTLYHAKPVIIQGAWMAAQATHNQAQFMPYAAHMKALLDYWDRERLDSETGLYVWHDQLESGADNLPISTCPSPLSDCWNETIHALTISSADVMTFLEREHIAFSLFANAWANSNTTTTTTTNNNNNTTTRNILSRTSLLRLSRQSRLKATAIRDSINKYFWNQKNGYYVAYNISARAPVLNRVYLMGFPLFGVNLSSTQQAAQVAQALQAKDMLGTYGIRSASTLDPRYNNDNIINPYSNWRGPVWVIANAVLAYSLADFGFEQQAWDMANRIVNTTALDLINSNTWHECYDAEAGEGLAAPGFLSWNTLVASLLSNLRANVNPFVLTNGK